MPALYRKFYSNAIRARFLSYRPYIAETQNQIYPLKAAYQPSAKFALFLRRFKYLNLTLEICRKYWQNRRLSQI